MNSELIRKLAKRTGKFSGRGRNHEGQNFHGHLELEVLLGGLGVSIHFKATGDNGVLFHEERSMVAPQLSGKIGLFNLNTNMPGLLPLDLKSEHMDENGNHRAVFSFGNREKRDQFREEITLELFSSGELEYKYAWGLPGGDFAERSGAVMKEQ